MEIFEALDATGCAHSAAALAGVDPKTVRRYAQMRDTDRPVDGPIARPKLIDLFIPKIEEWVDRSQGAVRADKVHERLQLVGFTGDERMTRHAVAKAKERWRADNRRTYRSGRSHRAGSLVAVRLGMGPECAWSGRRRRAGDAAVPVDRSSIAVQSRLPPSDRRRARARRPQSR
ncbi:hypothetical protein [Streptomyces huasconensis]|uniref:hypothetical protein n=1 Tax=Streptomyces huasconensis TaxID=1854574 RepID=UPI0033FFB4CF